MIRMSHDPTLKCPKCGAITQDEHADFCEECGADMDGPPQT